MGLNYSVINDIVKSICCVLTKVVANLFLHSVTAQHIPAHLITVASNARTQRESKYSCII